MKHLDDAEKLQKKARNRTLCLIAILFVLAAAFLAWLFIK